MERIVSYRYKETGITTRTLVDSYDKITLSEGYLYEGRMCYSYKDRMYDEHPKVVEFGRAVFAIKVGHIFKYFESQDKEKESLCLNQCNRAHLKKVSSTINPKNLFGFIDDHDHGRTTYKDIQNFGIKFNNSFSKFLEQVIFFPFTRKQDNLFYFQDRLFIESLLHTFFSRKQLSYSFFLVDDISLPKPMLVRDAIDYWIDKHPYESKEWIEFKNSNIFRKIFCKHNNRVKREIEEQVERAKGFSLKKFEFYEKGYPYQANWTFIDNCDTEGDPFRMWDQFVRKKTSWRSRYHPCRYGFQESKLTDRTKKKFKQRSNHFKKQFITLKEYEKTSETFDIDIFNPFKIKWR